MPIDVERTVPVLVHLDPKEWERFKGIAGRRRASYRLRRLMALYNAKNATPARTK